MTFKKSNKTVITQHSSLNKTNPNRKPKESPNLPTRKFIEGAKVVSEQYRHTLAIYKVIVSLKGINTIKSLLMHSKDLIPDVQKTDMIYHWKCPAHNCRVECIGETNRSPKERVSDHRNQTTSAIKSHHTSTKHPKAEL